MKVREGERKKIEKEMNTINIEKNILKMREESQSKRENLYTY